MKYLRVFSSRGVHPPGSDEKINQDEIFEGLYSHLWGCTPLEVMKKTNQCEIYEDSGIGPRGNLLGNKTGAISLIGNNPIEHSPETRNIESNLRAYS